MKIFKVSRRVTFVRKALPIMGMRVCLVSFCLFSLAGCNKQSSCTYHRASPGHFSQQTTLISPSLTLAESSPDIPLIMARELVTRGRAIGRARVGPATAQTTTLSGHAFTLPLLANDFSSTPISFDLSYVGDSDNTGTVSIRLDTAAGVPAQVSTFNDLRILVSVINAQLISPAFPQTPVDVYAEAADLGDGSMSINFYGTSPGVTSNILLNTSTANAAAIGLSDHLVSTSGGPKVDNGYSAFYVRVVDAQGAEQSATSASAASAASISTVLNRLEGVSASAKTEVALSSIVSQSGNLSVTINDLVFSFGSAESFVESVNGSEEAMHAGLWAQIDTLRSAIILRSTHGNDIQVGISSPDDGDSVVVVGNREHPASRLEVDLDGIISNGAQPAHSSAVVVGGSLTIALDVGYDIYEPLLSSWFQPINDAEFRDVVVESFNPEDDATYNERLSLSIFDSLEIEHSLQLYFVKRPYQAWSASSAAIDSHWQVYALIDGYDVGDPNIFLPPPLNREPTRAVFELFFDSSGEFLSEESDTMLISYWTPVDGLGLSNGALGPQPPLSGSTAAVSDPPSSSNFVISGEQISHRGEATMVFNDYREHHRDDGLECL